MNSSLRKSLKRKKFGKNKSLGKKIYARRVIMQSLKPIRQAEVDNFFKQSFEQKKLIPLYTLSEMQRSVTTEQVHTAGPAVEILPLVFFVLGRCYRRKSKKIKTFNKQATHHMPGSVTLLVHMSPRSSLRVGLEHQQCGSLVYPVRLHTRKKKSQDQDRTGLPKSTQTSLV